LWICRLELVERFSEPGADTEPADLTMNQVNAFPSRRLSNKGYLPMSDEHYLKLLDWTGRQIRSDKRGSIPPDLAPILTRLRLEPSRVPEVVSGFSKHFRSGVGRVASMVNYAKRLGRRWIAGVRHAAEAFGT
jgi:hypothetical protein